MVRLNRILVSALLLFGVTPFLASCIATERKAPPKISQVQIREIQTRLFPMETVLNGMKAVSSALQDEGYTILNANTDLGLVTADRVINDVDKSNRNAQIFWLGFAKDYRASRAWKVTANISNVKNMLRVRISFVEQEINESGGIIYSQQVTDPKPYQDVFSKIDNSVFLQKNNL